MGHRLRVVVREDLSPAQQAVQSIHAPRQFISEHPDQDKTWFTSSNTIAMLAVANEQALDKLLRKAAERGVRASYFEEPDIGYKKTAICLEPSEEARKICAGLVPALKGL